ncbi:MAG: hypothetical protein WBV94_08990, partial [Blastocatellia bacterium]
DKPCPYFYFVTALPLMHSYFTMAEPDETINEGSSLLEQAGGQKIRGRETDFPPSESLVTMV